MEVREATVAQTEHGAVPTSEGWFVLNLAEVMCTRHPKGGEWTQLEPWEPKEAQFAHYGIGIHVLHPGQPNGKYHSETVQEDFLVLHGECILIVEDEERRLKQWDFFHCAPGTHHIIVGAGDGPCAILMTGARGHGKKLHYPLSEVAAKYGASAPEETSEPSVAYSDSDEPFENVRATWPLA